MNYINLYLVLITGLTIAVWNAYVILWGVHKNLPFWEEKSKQYSIIWHGVGWALRFEIAILVVWLLTFHPGTLLNWHLMDLWAFTFLNVMWTGYDFVINLIRYLHAGTSNLWYVDDKGFNGFMMDLCGGEIPLWILRALLIFEYRKINILSSGRIMRWSVNFWKNDLFFFIVSSN